MSVTTTEPVGPGGDTFGRTHRLSPRQRQRISRGAQYAIFIVAAGVLLVVANWGEIREHFFDLEVAGNALPDLFVVALKNTVVFTLTGYAFGFVLGMVVALMRLSSVGPYRWISLIYIEIFRGVPALLIFLMIGFGVPTAFPGFDVPGGIYGTVALALGLVSAAYLAETFRAGIQAVPRGQMEAARSLGMSYSRAMISIIIPQALRIVVPPLTNELVMLFKDSSLVFVLGVTSATSELTKFGSDLATEHADTTPMVIAGLTYLLVTVPLGYLVRRLEARQARGR